MFRRLITGAALLTAVLTSVTTPASAADTPLRDLAAARGIYLGTAVTGGSSPGGTGTSPGPSSAPSPPATR